MIKFILKSFFKKNFFGFVYGHSHFSESKVKNIKKYLYKEDYSVIQEYENKFANLIGVGSAVSFASARMALFAYLKSINIKKNDEVIVLGFTCAVVINSILKAKAKPIFCDLNEKNFGNSIESIKEKISVNTKLIIVQHTFGLPADISEVLKYVKALQIKVIEDCAISFGTKVNNTTLGDFADAAIFSTDHSKPINTILGGLIYSKDKNIINKIREIQFKSAQIPNNKKNKIFKRFMFEKFFFKPQTYGKSFIFEYFFNKIYDWSFNDDNTPYEHHKYEYPLKLPTFIAMLGIYQLEYWISNKEIIKNNFLRILNTLLNYLPDGTLPDLYFDNKYQISCNRLVFCLDIKDKFYLSIIEKLVDVRWIWFKKPIIDTNNDLSEFGYVQKSCPKSEEIGEKIINIPIPYSQNYADILIKNLDDSFRSYKKKF